eukprot:3668017-Heterocapsa_arctica.AAC.1
MGSSSSLSSGLSSSNVCLSGLVCLNPFVRLNLLSFEHGFMSDLFGIEETAIGLLIRVLNVLDGIGS